MSRFHSWILVSCLLIIIQANISTTQKTTTKSVMTSVKKFNLTTLSASSNKISLPNEPINILKRLENLQKQILSQQSEGIQRIKTQQYENEAKFEVIFQALDKIKSRPTPSATTTSAKVTISLPTLTVNGKQYFFSYKERQMSWQGADNFCKANGMFLISLEAEGELESLKLEYRKIDGANSRFALTSGVYVENERHWKWSRENLTIKGFNPEKSSNIYHKCVCADETRINMCHCGVALPFVCES